MRIFINLSFEKQKANQALASLDGLNLVHNPQKQKNPLKEDPLNRLVIIPQLMK